MRRTGVRLARSLTPDGPVSGEYDDGRVRADDGIYQVGTDGRLLLPCEPSALYCARPAEPDFFADMYTDVGGERRQEANTELMLFKPGPGGGW
jgi:hypothetical protein